MKIDQLLHFYETAKVQHIGKAAKILRISPSGISYSIECLERDLDTVLFEKRGKRIFLTEPGRRLLDKIPDVLNSIDSMRSYVNSSSVEFRGHYRMAATHLLSNTMLIDTVSKIMKKFPKIGFELLSLRSSQVLNEVVEQNVDLGVCFNPQDNPIISKKIIYTGSLKIYCRKSHPILKMAKPLKELHRYGATLPKAFAGIDICESHPMFSKFKIDVDQRFAHDNYAVAISLVKNSNCWGFFPDWFESLPEFKLTALSLPANWDAKYHVAAIWLRDKVLDMGLKSIVDDLADKYC